MPRSAVLRDGVDSRDDDDCAAVHDHRQGGAAVRGRDVRAEEGARVEVETGREHDVRVIHPSLVFTSLPDES